MRAPRLTHRRCGIWMKASSCWAPQILRCLPRAGRRECHGHGTL
nr:MAG TPA: hypothetical protein [Caudoviricetes sp.]